MTKLMEQAIERLRSLPVERQDQVAGFLLYELESDRKWEETTEKYADKLDKLVADVIDSDRRGECDPLDPDRM
jgi:hypothetical protein